MTIKRLGALSALLLTFAVLTGACSSDSKSSASSSSSSSTAAGDKTAFCKTNGDINDSAKDVTSAAEFLTVIKGEQGKLAAFLDEAPAEVKADAKTLVDAANKAISTGDATPFQTDAKITAAGQKVDAFCGQGSDSSTASSS